MKVGPGTKDYGALSWQYSTMPNLIWWRMYPAIVFIPRPNVDSAVIRLNRYDTPPVDVEDETLMFRLIRAAFNQRRKTLVNGLNNFWISMRIKKLFHAQLRRWAYRQPYAGKH